jgi:biopolymer transport protein ExbD
MRIPTGGDEDDSGMVNLTPLIDVVFLLLIFFMVTATFQADERDFTISVPEAEHGNPIQDLPDSLFVGIREDGSFTVGSSVLDKEQLRQVLVKAKRKNEKQRVILRAHRSAECRFPTIVMDLCKSIGIEMHWATAPSPGDN